VTAAQLARACAVFQVDELVKFNDGELQEGGHPRKDVEGDNYMGFPGSGEFLHHVLSYLDTPHISGRHSSLCTLTLQLLGGCRVWICRTIHVLTNGVSTVEE
jgi:hypothetical protein